jgi:hypothetical protein
MSSYLPNELSLRSAISWLRHEIRELETADSRASILDEACDAFALAYHIEELLGEVLTFSPLVHRVRMVALLSMHHTRVSLPADEQERARIAKRVVNTWTRKQQQRSRVVTTACFEALNKQIVDLLNIRACALRISRSNLLNGSAVSRGFEGT